ncbi:MAG TPA: amidohydrolase family protein, partial [Acidimicrobiales bacterium]|nr:amidohydrolase family protein [Acidimicrobiales bacterium]
DFPDFDDEMTTLMEMMRSSGRPLSISLAQFRPGPGYRRQLEAIDKANREGLQMRAQVAARAIGLMIGLEGSVNPLKGSASYRELEHLPLAERVVVLRQLDTRARILEELADRPGGVRQPLDRMFELGDPPDYEPRPENSIAARAKAAGCAPEQLLYDLLLADDGRALLYLPFLNYFDGNLDAAAELLAHPHTVPGLGDGGAHVGTICDASFATTLLTYWARDRKNGTTFELPWVVNRQCRATAETVGLLDRGVLAPGYKADINVIDFQNLRNGRPEIRHDLPAGGKRLVQPASGYLHTIVSGKETYANGQPTGELPGRLVRGAKHDPASHPVRREDEA